MSMTSDLKLTLRFDADTKRFANEVKGADSEVKKFGNSSKIGASQVKQLSDKTNTASSAIRSLKGDLFKLASGFAALAGINGMKSMIEQQATLIDQTAKQADKLGVTTQALTEFRYAAELTGVGANNLDTSLQRMVRRISEAAQGAGTASPALRQLGLDARQLSRMTPEQQLKAVADAFQNVNSQSDRVRLAFKLFDTEGVGMVNMLENGSNGLNSMAREAEQLGISLNRVDAAKVEAANDAMFKVNETTRASIQALTVELAPAIGGMANLFVEYAKQNGGMNRVMADGIHSSITGIGYLANSYRGLELIIKSIDVAWLGFKASFMIVNQAMINTLHYTAEYIFKALVSPLQGTLDLAGLVSDEAENMADKLRKFSNMPPPVIFDPVAINNAKLDASDALWELRTLASKPLPKEAMEEWYKDVREKFQKLAIERAKTLDMRSASGLGASQLLSSPKSNAIDAYYNSSDKINEDYQKRLAIQADFQNKEKIEEEYAYSDRFDRLQDQFDRAYAQAKGNNDLRTQLEKDYFNTRTALRLDHEARLTKIEDDAEKRRLAAQKQAQIDTTSFISNQLSMTTNFLKQSGGEQKAAYKTLFAIQKAAAIPSMVIDTNQAYTKALSAYPPPYGQLMGAAVLASGGAAIGIAAGTTITGMAHDGINKIPKENEGTWLLKANEMVLNPTQADNFRWMVDVMNQMKSAMHGTGGTSAKSNGGVHVSVNVDNKTDSIVSVEESIDRDGQKQINFIIDKAVSASKAAIFEDADNGGAISTRIRGA
ncbi:hypothetical protein [Vibrio sp. ER1A]|uniref:hypothetical protein n=1 Tax=Vibrio sp. ER1A TaxID=1517681 RepID=UPI0004DD3726|nr:hypothetical protein [Vibrio sp. ER1A]KFA99593.1 hypothetical protein HW45_02700 [Vibrio sp. ER1A]